MNYRRNEDKWCDNYDNRIRDNYILSVEVTVDVSAEPLSLINAKAHIRVDHADEDTYITQTIKEAREQVEDEINLALAPKTIKVQVLSEKGYVNLPYWTPEGSITEVKDHEGTVLVDETDYTIENGVLQTSFSDVVFVKYTTGFTTCPNKYLRMIKERLAYLWNERGDKAKTNNNTIWLA